MLNFWDVPFLCFFVWCGKKPAQQRGTSAREVVPQRHFKLQSSLGDIFSPEGLWLIASMDGLPHGSLETFHDSLKSLIHDRWWLVVVMVVMVVTWCGLISLIFFVIQYFDDIFHDRWWLIFFFGWHDIFWGKFLFVIQELQVMRFWMVVCVVSDTGWVASPPAQDAIVITRKTPYLLGSGIPINF